MGEAALCAVCRKVQAVIQQQDSRAIITIDGLVSMHGFKEDDARAGLRAFSNCDNYPRGCHER